MDIITNLCIELIESLILALKTVTDFAIRYDISLPDTLPYLIKHAQLVLRELDSSPPNLQRLFRTPPDTTEPGENVK